MPTLRLAFAQLNVTVGDLDGNRRLIEEAIRRAQAWLADVVAVPELAVTGYPPEDLLLKPQFVAANRRMLERIVPATRGIVALVGFVDGAPGRGLHNAMAVLAHGRWVATYRKQCLPNYGVFDEKRYFAPGTRPLILEIGAARVGLTICEDLWEEAPCWTLARAGAQLLVNISASPYHAGKLLERQRLFARRARANRLAVGYCNLVGGQDELVFDGGSLALDAAGRLRGRAGQFREDLLVWDCPVSKRPGLRLAGLRLVRMPHRLRERPPLAADAPARLGPVEEVYEALVLGLRDYVRKNGFSTVVLGLSGGIDSALTACLAADALGAAHVRGVVMPSRFSSAETQADAKALGEALGIEVQEISIEPVFRAYLDTLQPRFGDRPPDATEQNIQARIRGHFLMALSNKFGWLVLTTGNKSELATGYTTLYGDMAGGFAVIKDVPKTLVYQLARFRNRRPPREIAPWDSRLRRRRSGDIPRGWPIPERIFQRPPTAELAPGQRDQDTLPPYETLDRILTRYVEEDRSLRQILSLNQVDRATAGRVIRMVDVAEYKRRQGPPGIKITPKAFGKDRRMPITNRYVQG